MTVHSEYVVLVRAEKDGKTGLVSTRVVAPANDDMSARRKAFKVAEKQGYAPIGYRSVRELPKDPSAPRMRKKVSRV